MTISKEDIAGRQRRCPRLGGPVDFNYCCTAGDHRSPCFKVFDCWWETFDVVAYFEQRLSKETFERLKNTKIPNKTASLIDLIRQARNRTNRGT